MKLALKIIILVLIAALILAMGYLIYIFIGARRIADNQALPVAQSSSEIAQTDTEYTALTYNIGFGAYSDDYSFFMDGGKYSRAFSEEAVNENVAGAVAAMQAESPDFLLVQEVDTNSTRSYHVDERVPIASAFEEFSSDFAINYNCAYLLYPLNEPHGKSVAGIYTLSFAGIDRAVRRSLPVEGGFRKLIDLDRCYSISEIPVDGGKTLYLINVHLSAYTADGTIAVDQLKMLFADMAELASGGNYIVCGGDFNKDLYGNSSSVFGVSGEDYTWAQPFPTELIPEGFVLVNSLDEENPVPSNRLADAPYVKGTTFVNMLDGFIVSNNIEVTDASVVDTGFKYSDHNPVKMTFVLKGA